MPAFSNKVYYLFRPLIPWSVRLAIRRFRATRRRITYSNVWPIDENAGATPPAWPGWPEGKKFALVLTHDAEGSKGLGRVERLMALDARYGFRSCFNLVPEGEYRVPASLRLRLQQAGFEVGVHGLRHDGKMFLSRARFDSEARRIREYVSLWGASGFRAPFMHHDLAWMHLLGTEYDGSTFDTDPFEPQPDAVGTIFPFWVVGPDGNGYVELPYTLAQDSTLFTVLQEQNIDIWKRKLDWIASRGGMALLNAHPDYMCFEGRPRRDEYPVSLYEEFLRYAREKYEGEYWAALPREVSRYYTGNVPVESRGSNSNVRLRVAVSSEAEAQTACCTHARVQSGAGADDVGLGRDHPRLLD